jgi:uncharacterized protein YqgC (DUF456 family)
MDILLIILGLILILVGIIGCVVPGLPGPFSAWLGLLVTMLAKSVPDDWSLLGITFLATLIISILDYFIPAIGTKKFGGSKYGVYGAIIGLLVGIFAPIPGGILIGPFVGAFVGEYLKNNDVSKSLKAAFGAFIGFLASTGMQLILSLVFAFLYGKMLIENWDTIFSGL